MLLSFRFANHRSFRDEQQINLTPIYEDDAADEFGHEAVPVVGIFGANASGKSNALGALTFMRQWAIRSDREVEPGSGVTRDPFRLATTSLNEPSRYIVDLLLNGVRHTYGFSLDNERVIEEWMYAYPLKKKRRIFERDGDDFKWGEESGRQGELERISGITAQTALFLSTAARFASGTKSRTNSSPAILLHNVYRWFIRFRGRGNPEAFWTPQSAGFPWAEMPEERQIIVELLRAADVGIADIVIETIPSPLEDSLLSSDELETIREEAARDMRRRFRQQLAPRARIRFAHRSPGDDVLLDLHDESAGTRQLLDLAVDVARILRTGGTMTVDEIDASLHPMLSAKLIGLFQSPVANPFNAQLIFTSHDATLLGTFDAEEILRRDQIWFSEKEDDGASTLYPLSDFKPRKAGENRQRRYLNGNYGAVPDLSTDLFEQAVAAREGHGAEAAR